MNPPINIQDVVENKLYIVTNRDNEILGIVQAHNSGAGYAKGDALSVQYVDIVVDEEGKIKYDLVDEAFDLFPGNATETSDGLKLHNIADNYAPVSGGKRKPRRSQKNKSKSKSKTTSKKGGARKSKKGGRR